MKHMPTRDTNGKCQGECRDIVYESDKRRQAEINAMKMDYDTPTPSIPWASKRNAPPSFLGGHV